MDKNVSASFTLSLLVVTFFAVALYQPDSRLQSSTARTKRSPVARPVEDRAAAGPLRQPDLSAPVAPEPTKPDSKVALARSRGAGISQVQVTRHVDPLPAPAVEARKVIAPRNEPTRPPQGPSTPSVTEPRGAFTSVRSGETLPDVARRVYGPGGDAERLWKANRDLIEKKDSPLRPGTMLRTP
jgi:nucleoid-associated protein YgaU